ncbi:unnamed protein product [[Candida] boidinii]|nr:unnamed protein product [[Candida] boidinii]
MSTSPQTDNLLGSTWGDSLLSNAGNNQRIMTTNMTPSAPEIKVVNDINDTSVTTNNSTTNTGNGGGGGNQNYSSLLDPKTNKTSNHKRGGSLASAQSSESFDKSGITSTPNSHGLLHSGNTTTSSNSGTGGSQNISSSNLSKVSSSINSTNDDNVSNVSSGNNPNLSINTNHGNTKKNFHIWYITYKSFN